MAEALITNLINNIFHSVWLYHLALEPKHDRRGQIFFSVLFTVFEEMAALVFLALPIPINLRYLLGFVFFAVILTFTFLCTLSACHLPCHKQQLRHGRRDNLGTAHRAEPLFPVRLPFLFARPP